MQRRDICAALRQVYPNHRYRRDSQVLAVWFSAARSPNGLAPKERDLIHALIAAELKK